MRITGFGAIDCKKNNFSLLKAGVVVTSPRETLPCRLNKIYRTTKKIISETKPQVLVLEKLYVHYHHPTTAFILGQARGIICLACAERALPLIEYSATEVKKAIVGRGLASKHQIKMMVGNILKLKMLPHYSDITDALALAIAYGAQKRLYLG